MTGCGNPGVPYLSAKRRFSEKTTLNFSCKKGHNLTGAVNLTCFEGNWTSEIPQCVGKKNESIKWFCKLKSANTQFK